MIVLAIAVVIVLGGVVLAVVGTPSASRSAGSGPLRTVPGSPIRAVSAATVIARIASGGAPPHDVIDALALPSGSTYVTKTNSDRGVGPFDRSVEIAANYPEKSVATFYEKLLSDEKWSTNSIGTAGSVGTTEIIATRSASDGYQWRVVVTTRPVGAVVAPALAGGSQSAARTRIVLALYEVEDAS